MSLRKKIFFSSVMLSISLIALIVVTHSVYVLHFHHRLMDKKYLSEISIRASEVERLMLWDDRVAVAELLESVTGADSCVIYAFIEQESQPYAQTFPDAAWPTRLANPSEVAFQRRGGRALP